MRSRYSSSTLQAMRASGRHHGGRCARTSATHHLDKVIRRPELERLAPAVDRERVEVVARQANHHLVAAGVRFVSHATTSHSGVTRVQRSSTCAIGKAYYVKPY